MSHSIQNAKWRSGAPRISVNKFAEYATTPNAAQRNQIVREQLKPLGKPIPQRYIEAEQGIVRAFTAPNGRWTEIIFAELQRLNARGISSQWDAGRKQNCIEALGHILQFEDELQLKNVTYTPGQRNLTGYVEVAGVKVSMRPEVLLRGRVKGEEKVGAIKLIFSKTHPLSDEAGIYVAMLMHEYEKQLMGEEASSRLCFAIDVFQRRIYKAPTARTMRWRELEAAATEYAQHWREELRRISQS